MKNICITSIFQDCSDFQRVTTVYPARLEENSRNFTRINTRNTTRGPGNPEMPRREQKKHAFHGAKKACFFCFEKFLEKSLKACFFKAAEARKRQNKRTIEKSTV